MFALVLVVLICLAVVVRAAAVQRRLKTHECLWQTGSAPLTIELRRQVRLARTAFDSQEFPQPREFRTLTIRLAGVPLWSHSALAALPLDVDARLGAVSADEFDQLFSRAFRKHRHAPSVRILFTGWFSPLPASVWRRAGW